jgi:RNA polymerase sigma-70 factor (ECF subfamily)
MEKNNMERISITVDGELIEVETNTYARRQKKEEIFMFQIATTDASDETLHPSGEELYNLYFRQIYSYLLRQLKQAELAEDLAQETFYRACKALPRLQGLLYARPWLYRIATNLMNDTLRRQQLLTWQSLDADVYDPPSEEDIEEQISSAELVHVALQQIPADYRKALLLYVDEGYSYAQVAQAVGIAPSGAKMYISRARSRFRVQYAAYAKEVERVYVAAGGEPAED